MRLRRPEVHLRQPCPTPDASERKNRCKCEHQNPHAKIDVVRRPARVVASDRGRHEEHREQKVSGNPGNEVSAPTIQHRMTDGFPPVIFPHALCLHPASERLSAKPDAQSAEKHLPDHPHDRNQPERLHFIVRSHYTDAQNPTYSVP